MPLPAPLPHHRSALRSLCLFFGGCEVRLENVRHEQRPDTTPRHTPTSTPISAHNHSLTQTHTHTHSVPSSPVPDSIRTTPVRMTHTHIQIPTKHEDACKQARQTSMHMFVSSHAFDLVTLTVCLFRARARALASNSHPEGLFMAISLPLSHTHTHTHIHTGSLSHFLASWNLHSSLSRSLFLSRV